MCQLRLVRRFDSAIQGGIGNDVLRGSPKIVGEWIDNQLLIAICHLNPS